MIGGVISSDNVVIIGGRNSIKFQSKFDCDRMPPMPLRFRGWIIFSIGVDVEKIGRRLGVIATMPTVTHKMIALQIKTIYIYTHSAHRAHDFGTIDAHHNPAEIRWVQVGLQVQLPKFGSILVANSRTAIQPPSDNVDTPRVQGLSYSSIVSMLKKLTADQSPSSWHG